MKTIVDVFSDTEVTDIEIRTAFGTTELSSIFDIISSSSEPVMMYGKKVYITKNPTLSKMTERDPTKAVILTHWGSEALNIPDVGWSHPNKVWYHGFISNSPAMRQAVATGIIKSIDTAVIHSTDLYALERLGGEMRSSLPGMLVVKTTSGANARGVWVVDVDKALRACDITNGACTAPQEKDGYISIKNRVVLVQPYMDFKEEVRVLVPNMAYMHGPCGADEFHDAISVNHTVITSVGGYGFGNTMGDTLQYHPGTEEYVVGDESLPSTVLCSLGAITEETKEPYLAFDLGYVEGRGWYLIEVQNHSTFSNISFNTRRALVEAKINYEYNRQKDYLWA